MHDCLDCGQACDCDGEDTWFDDPPDDCAHGCDDDFEDEDEW